MIKRLLVMFVMMSSLLVVQGVATPVQTQAAVASGCSSSFLGLPAWYQYLEVGPDAGDDCAIKGPKDAEGNFNWQRAIPLILLAVTEIGIRIASLVAVGFVIYGGIKYILTQGDPEKAKTARQTIQNALIGLVLAIASAAIVAFIGNRLG